MIGPAALRPLADFAPSVAVSAWIVDIERFPRTVYEWSARHGKYTQESMVIEEARMCSWAAKRVGHGTVVYSDEHVHGYERMVRALWQLLNSADIVITYNGISFDAKHWDGAFADLGLPKPSPYKHVDLLRVVRRNFGWDYKSLRHVCQRLGVAEQKADPGGFDTWKRCMAGDAEAWATMKSYNIQDVRTTESLFWRLLPWAGSALPNAQLYGADECSCPACGSTDLSPIGDVVAVSNSYAAYRCVSCGTVSRANFRRHGVDRRNAA